MPDVTFDWPPRPKPPGRRGPLAVLAAITLFVSTMASASNCVHHDLQAFSICLPPVWQPVPGQATDSRAGRFVAGEAQLSYDHGLYSDPLNPPEGALDYQVQLRTIDGRAARRVSFRLPGPGGPVQVVGLHVPEAGRSGMGALRLTVLLRSRQPALLHNADEILGSIRFPTR